MPASVPRTTAPVALSAAIWRLSQAADRSWSFCRSDTYQRVENPPQSVTSRDSLKEKTTSSRIGT
jgi:hypothetical protein